MVSIHQGAFESLRNILNTMLSGAQRAPAFMQPACPGKLLKVAMELNVNATDSDLDAAATATRTGSGTGTGKG